MKSYLLIVGDKDGLRSGEHLSGMSTRSGPDLSFVHELRTRREKLRMPAATLSKLAGYSHSYVSMIETERMLYPSEEAKANIRDVLSKFEKK